MALGLAIAAISTIYGIAKDKQALGEEEQAQRAQRRINKVQEARKRRATIREANILTARAEAVGASTGGGSSNLSVAVGSASSQLSSNLNFLTNTGAESQRATDALGRSARARSSASLSRAVGSFAAQNSDRIDNLFE